MAGSIGRRPSSRGGTLYRPGTWVTHRPGTWVTHRPGTWVTHGPGTWVTLLRRFRTCDNMTFQTKERSLTCHGTLKGHWRKSARNFSRAGPRTRFRFGRSAGNTGYPPRRHTNGRRGRRLASHCATGAADPEARPGRRLRTWCPRYCRCEPTIRRLEARRYRSC